MFDFRKGSPPQPRSSFEEDPDLIFIIYHFDSLEV